MSADESVSLLHQLSHALQLDGTLADGTHADMLGVLEAIASEAADLPRPPSAGLVDAAIALGERRRAAGLDAESVIEDFAALRQAIRRVLRALPHGSDQHVAALERFDARTTLSMRASLMGHSRPQLEQAGRWAEARRDLVDETERMQAGRPRTTPDDVSTTARR